MRDGKDRMSLSPVPDGMNPGIAGFLFVAGRMPHARTCGMQTILQAGLRGYRLVALLFWSSGERIQGKIP